MASNEVHIGTVQSQAWWRLFTKRVVWIPIVVIILAAIGWGIGTAIHNRNTQKAANAADQKSLQSQLQTAVNGNNPQGTVYLVQRLLDGQKSGRFTFDKSAQSQLYLDRGSAYLTLGQYRNAVADYEQAIALNSSNKLVALQWEVEARYKMGDRKQLIPLYQELVTLEGQSQNPRRDSTVMLFQQNVQALQNGQEIQF